MAQFFLAAGAITMLLVGCCAVYRTTVVHARSVQDEAIVWLPPLAIVMSYVYSATVLFASLAVLRDGIAPKLVAWFGLLIPVLTGATVCASLARKLPSGRAAIFAGTVTTAGIMYYGYTQFAHICFFVQTGN